MGDWTGCCIVNYHISQSKQALLKISSIIFHWAPAGPKYRLYPGPFTAASSSYCSLCPSHFPSCFSRTVTRMNLHVRVSSRFAEFRSTECRLRKLFFPSFSFLIPFINAIQLFMGVNQMRVKILPLLCRLGT